MWGYQRATSTFGGAAMLSLSLFASVALGQAPDESTLAAARQLGQQGVSLYEQGDYAGASDKLERAYAVVKVPTLGLWSGRALEKLGKLVEASQRYREVTLVVIRPSDPEVLRSAQADAQKAYDALGSRIPQLTLQLDGATANEASVTIDGKAVPSALVGVALPVNPGTHQVEGRRGQDTASQQIALAEGERRAITLTFTAGAQAAGAPSETAAPPAAVEAEEPDQGHESILPWVVVGAGGALTVTGVVFMALASSAASKVKNVKDGTPWSAVQSDYDHVPVYSGLGLALIGAGAAAITTGLVWKFAGGDGGSGGERGLSVTAGASSVALKGVF